MVERLRLTENCVDLWYRRIPRDHLKLLTPEYERLWCILSESEQARAKRYLRAEPRERFVFARGMLRLLLAQYCGIGPQQVAISVTANEKPILQDRPDLHFNVSHSSDVIVIGLSRNRLGVDVERIDHSRDWQLIAKHQFHPQEQAWLSGQPVSHQTISFFQLWTSKEAYLKGLGVGLGHPLKSFAILPEGLSRRPHPELDNDCSWIVQSVSLYDDYEVGVATPGEYQICCKRWEEL